MYGAPETYPKARYLLLFGLFFFLRFFRRRFGLLLRSFPGLYGEREKFFLRAFYLFASKFFQRGFQFMYAAFERADRSEERV